MNEPFLGGRGSLVIKSETVPIDGWTLRLDPTRDAWSGSFAITGAATAREAVIRLEDAERPGTYWTGRVRLVAPAADPAWREFEGAGPLRRERSAA